MTEIKKYICKVSLFIIPILVLITCYIILEVFFQHAFSFRTWEVLIWLERPMSTYGTFYPNQEITKTEYGDLNPKDTNSIPKFCSWTTDDLGFRNDNTNYSLDVAFIGDSFVAGSSLSQEETLSSRFKKYSKKISAQFSTDLNTFLFLVKSKAIPKPKKAVYLIVERSLPNFAFQAFNPNSYTEVHKPSSYVIARDKLKKKGALKTLQSFIFNENGNRIGMQSKINKEWFFLQGKQAEIKLNKSKITSIINHMKNYQSEFKKQGIELFFSIAPNKETVYYQYVPLNYKPKFLKKIADLTLKDNLNYIDLNKRFSKASREKLIYHLDDTHWNKEGANLAAKIIASELIAGH